MLDSGPMPARTGYENSTISVEPITDVEGYLEQVGCCERCGATESPNWYVRKWSNNYLPDYQGICQKCYDEEV